MQILGFTQTEIAAKLIIRLLHNTYHFPCYHRLAEPDDLLVNGEHPENYDFAIVSGFLIDDRDKLLEVAGFVNGAQSGMIAKVAHDVSLGFDYEH